MCRIKGFNALAAERVIAARQQHMIDSLHQLKRLAQLNDGELDVLIASNACEPLSGHRHQSHWTALGIAKRHHSSGANLMTHPLFNQSSKRERQHRCGLSIPWLNAKAASYAGIKRDFQCIRPMLARNRSHDLTSWATSPSSRSGNRSPKAFNGIGDHLHDPRR